MIDVQRFKLGQYQELTRRNCQLCHLARLNSAKQKALGAMRSIIIKPNEVVPAWQPREQRWEPDALQPVRVCKNICVRSSLSVECTITRFPPKLLRYVERKGGCVLSWPCYDLF